jgi:hypothetical protein
MNRYNPSYYVEKDEEVDYLFSECELYYDNEIRVFMAGDNENGEYVKYTEYSSVEAKCLCLENELKIIKQKYEKLNEKYEELLWHD